MPIHIGQGNDDEGGGMGDMLRKATTDNLVGMAGNEAAFLAHIADDFDECDMGATALTLRDARAMIVELAMRLAMERVGEVTA